MRADPRGDVRLVLVERGEREVRLAILVAAVGGGAAELVAQGGGEGGRILEDDERVARQVRGEGGEVDVGWQVALGPEEGAAAGDVVDQGARLGRGEIDG